MSLEFEIPLVSFIFILILNIEYFSKKKIHLLETKPFKFIMLSSLALSLIDTTLHFISAFSDASEILKFYTFVSISNKILSTLFVSIFSALFCYTLLISYDWATKKYNVIKNWLVLVNVIFAIVVSYMNVEIIEVGSVRNTTGSALLMGYLMVALFLMLSIIVCISNKNKFDKKHIAIFLILIMVVFLYIATIVFPGIIIYDLILALMCYIMYFTIENPDLQMLREFHKQRELANESNEEKTTFLFNMSNKIKQPLLSISNLCGETLLEDNMEEIKENVRTIKGSTNEVLQLVNDVLDISDLESRKIGIRGSKYKPEQLFEVLNRNFIKDLNTKIEYRFHYDKSIPEYLYGDSIRIKQVMNILLENAKKYTNEGFIEVNVNSIVKHDICRLVITVEDSGMGMTTEEIKHLFDKEKIYEDEILKTIDDTKSNLGVLKSIVNLMNGNVMVNSEYGKGSKFTIIIDQKVKEEKTKIIETVEQYEEMYENKKRILLVINHKEISKKINKMFKKDTYEIEEVSGGQACLEKIRKNEKFDLIIMEEDLEKLSSEDTLIKLKDTSGYKIPVILISNNKGFGAKEMYQEKGFKDVLFLPLKKEEVLKQVKEYIKGFFVK